MPGYHSPVIFVSRRINDGTGKFVVEQTVKQLIANGNHIKGAKVRAPGLTLTRKTVRIFEIPKPMI